MEIVGQKENKFQIIAKILQADSEDLLVLWLADQIVEIVGNEKEVSDKVLKIVQRKLE